MLPVGHERVELGSCGVPASGEEEEHRFGEGFNTSRSLLSLLAEFRDGVSSEGDSADGVEAGAVVEQDGQSPHAEDGVIYFDLGDDLLAVEFPKVEQFWNRVGGYFVCGRG